MSRRKARAGPSSHNTAALTLGWLVFAISCGGTRAPVGAPRAHEPKRADLIAATRVTTHRCDIPPAVGGGAEADRTFIALAPSTDIFRTFAMPKQAREGNFDRFAETGWGPSRWAFHAQSPMDPGSGVLTVMTVSPHAPLDGIELRARLGANDASGEATVLEKGSRYTGQEPFDRSYEAVVFPGTAHFMRNLETMQRCAEETFERGRLQSAQRPSHGAIPILVDAPMALSGASLIESGGSEWSGDNDEQQTIVVDHGPWPIRAEDLNGEWSALGRDGRTLAVLRCLPEATSCLLVTSEVSGDSVYSRRFDVSRPNVLDGHLDIAFGDEKGKLQGALMSYGLFGYGSGEIRIPRVVGEERTVGVVFFLRGGQPAASWGNRLLNLYRAARSRQ